jgi:hypothetical protein
MSINSATASSLAIKLVECFLHTAKTGANNATIKSESLLLHAQIGSLIAMALNAQNLFLFFIQNNPANQALKLMIKYFKTSLHFRKDCGIFCEGEQEQQWQLDKHNGLVGFSLISHSGLTRLTGFDGLSGLVNFIGLIGCNGCDSLVWYGAGQCGAQSNAVNLILRLFLYHFFTYYELMTSRVNPHQHK